MPDEDKKKDDPAKNEATEQPQDIPDFLKRGEVDDVPNDDENPADEEVEEPELVAEEDVPKAPVSAIDVSAPDESDDVDVFDEPTRGVMGRVDDLLAELNLGRKHFYMFGGCVFLLILGVVLSFSFIFSFFGEDPDDVVVAPEVIELPEEDKGPGLFERWFGGDDEEVEVVVEEDQPEESEEDDDDAEEEEPDSSVSDAIDAGSAKKTKLQSDAISLSVKLGKVEVVDDRLSFYVRSYRKVRNIFNTDLFDFLNGQENRQKSYDDYVTMFSASNEAAKLAYNELLSEVAQFEVRVDNVNADTNEIESRFFDALDGLDSEAIPGLLDAFQDLSKQRSVVKSELKARQAIADRYAKALPFIEKKIEAIEVNEDAFVKGVKVVDFDQVDLDLIIRGE